MPADKYTAAVDIYSMSADCLTTENLSLFSSVITWVLVMLGWLIINRQHNFRESRKELRISIDRIRSQLVKIEKKAILYHTTATPTGTLSSEIKLLITRITFDIKVLELLDADVYKLTIKDYRKSITLVNFDSARHEVHQHGSELVMEISSTTDDINEALEKAFRKKYPI